MLLRPGLGHPNEVGPLEELCEQEEQRRQDYLAGVDQQVKDLQVSDENIQVCEVADQGLTGK